MSRRAVEQESCAGRRREAETMIRTGWLRWVALVAVAGTLSAAGSGCGTSRRGEVRNWPQDVRSPDRLVRMKAVSAAARAPREDAIGPLIERLEDEDDVVRAMAYEALVRASGERLPFDPLGSAFERQEQTRAWKEWAERQRQGGRPGS